MQKYFSTFPDGRFGVGLLILRASAGVTTALFGAVLMSRLGAPAVQLAHPGQLILNLLLITGGIFLILGFMTPFVSIIMAGCQLIAEFISLTIAEPVRSESFGSLAVLLLSFVTIVLFFLGPGAYAIDARLYGRRRIFIPSRKNREATWL